MIFHYSLNLRENLRRLSWKINDIPFKCLKIQTKLTFPCGIGPSEAASGACPCVHVWPRSYKWTGAVGQCLSWHDLSRRCLVQLLVQLLGTASGHLLPTVPYNCVLLSRVSITAHSGTFTDCSDRSFKSSSCFSSSSFISSSTSSSLRLHPSSYKTFQQGQITFLLCYFRNIIKSIGTLRITWGVDKNSWYFTKNVRLSLLFLFREGFF